MSYALYNKQRVIDACLCGIKDWEEIRDHDKEINIRPLMKM